MFNTLVIGTEDFVVRDEAFLKCFFLYFFVLFCSVVFDVFVDFLFLPRQP